MSIGSAPEIGTTFSKVGDFPSMEEVMEWHKQWRAFVGDDLLGGYGVLCFPV